MTQLPLAIGVDLGGAKIEVALMDAAGHLLQRLRRPTDVKKGQAAIEAEILAAVHELETGGGSRPAGVGVGVAGQDRGACWHRPFRS